MFPFIRFTNWKQVKEAVKVVNYFVQFPFIRFTNWKQDGHQLECRNTAHSVSIHTLHELEARS